MIYVSQTLNGIPNCKKIVKSKFKSERINKNKHQSNVVLKEINKKAFVYMTFKYVFKLIMCIHPQRLQ